MKLYGYWRSSATYRVRILLNLKGLGYDYEPVNLIEGGQRSEAYHALNPQALVPTLEADGVRLTQSLAIAEYLEETRPSPPLLPSAPAARAAARAIAAAIACEAQPLMNLRVQNFLKAEGAFSPETLALWLDRFAGGASLALEAMLAETAGRFCVGDAPGLADAFLIPHLYAARRFSVDLSNCPTLLAIEAECARLEPFSSARPERQPDAPAAL